MAFRNVTERDCRHQKEALCQPSMRVAGDAIRRGRARGLAVLACIPVLTSCGANDPESESRLLAYTQCPLGGGLVAAIVDRAPGLPMARPVETAAGTKRVSVSDGYRVMLAFPDTDPFVNLKIETSMAGLYGADKQTVLDQMEHMSATSRGVLVNLERSVVGDVDIAALNNPGLDGAGLSLYTFFVDAKGIIATAYILNQRPERRAFQNFSEYQVLRDRFVSEFTACLAEDH